MPNDAPAHLDTDVLIRFLTGDDPDKQAAAATLLQSVASGQVMISAPDTVIADAVYVLSSPRLYHLPRAQVEALLTPLVRLRGFRVQQKRLVLRALQLYGQTNLDFGDTMIAAAVEQHGSGVLYSYDRGFDQLPSIRRVEP